MKEYKNEIIGDPIVYNEKSLGELSAKEDCSIKVSYNVCNIGRLQLVKNQLARI